MTEGWRATLTAATASAVFLVGAAQVASAEEIPVPDQAGWDAARQSIDLPGLARLTFVEMGTPGGTPVILLHGYTDNSRSWSLLAPHLSGRHLYALDLRGHGASEVVACCYGLDALAADVVAFMDAKGIDRADLVGHSLGSMTAAVVAALHPERVDDLALISTALRMPQGGNDWLWENVPALAHPIDPESPFMLEWYWNPTPVDEDFLTRERAESAARPQEVWEGVLIGLTLADWSLIAPRITAPTMVLWGDQDGLFTAEDQEAVRAALPDARFEAYAGYGHNMFWEIPGTVGPALADFLAD